MKKTLLFLTLLFASPTVFAQDFPFGQVSTEEIEMKKYDKDTSAHAVVLNEYGTSRIILASDNYTKVVFEYHIKIKIFDQSQFSKGTLEIPVYNGDNDAYEEVEDIQGTTYYKDENGLQQKAELDSKQVFRTKKSKHWTILKFAMPALRNGCVIEYKYRLSSPYKENFHSWEFQSDIPKKYSEYQVHIPAFWSYNASLKGHLKLTRNVADLESTCFTYGTAKCDCSHMVYGVSDIPAFVAEDNMTSPKNFLSAINFELVDYISFVNGSKIKYAKEWRDIDYQLKQEPEFGGQLKRKDLMKDRISAAITGKTDDLSKAQAIYAFLQKWYKWNNFIGIYSTDGIKKAFESHSGSVPDINLSLVAALNSAGINTEAVLLSTRENGFINTLYPALGDFNYVIAKTNIGDKSYLLDASDPYLAFGMLPLSCLNDKGRAFSLDKPSYWIDLGTTQQRESITYTYDLTLQDNGKLKGTLTRYFGGYSGYERRKAIKKFNTPDEYVENFGEKLPKFKILKSSIINIDSLDKPLGESYEVEINMFDNTNHNRLAFDPFILNKITTNPFKLAERGYPVDWGMPSDERYILTVHLPEKYAIENPPQEVSFFMPNKGGKFFTSFDGNSNSFTFSYLTSFNKSVYGPEEYPYLKELYNKIILAEKNEMVFKKKS
ncbi:MAG: hypothetical protein JWP78_1061 [Mucilaginibacter sp.]|nr:hypothetical protein [Mucilaginibacter sp.]